MDLASSGGMAAVLATVLQKVASDKLSQSFRARLGQRWRNFRRLSGVVSLPMYLDKAARELSKRKVRLIVIDQLVESSLSGDSSDRLSVFSDEIKKLRVYPLAKSLVAELLSEFADERFVLLSCDRQLLKFCGVCPRHIYTALPSEAFFDVSMSGKTPQEVAAAKSLREKVLMESHGEVDIFAGTAQLHDDLKDKFHLLQRL